LKTNFKIISHKKAQKAHDRKPSAARAMEELSLLRLTIYVPFVPFCG
jgi:hypothetical protein